MSGSFETFDCKLLATGPNLIFPKGDEIASGSATPQTAELLTNALILL